MQTKVLHYYVKVKINVTFKESKMKRAGVSNTEYRWIKDTGRKMKLLPLMDKCPALRVRLKYVKSTYVATYGSFTLCMVI